MRLSEFADWAGQAPVPPGYRGLAIATPTIEEVQEAMRTILETSELKTVEEPVIPPVPRQPDHVFRVELYGRSDEPSDAVASEQGVRVAWDVNSDLADALLRVAIQLEGLMKGQDDS